MTTRDAVQKRGVSCRKVAGALITLGWSILVVGLSRTQRVTRSHCATCDTRWTMSWRAAAQ